jgi:hypothetical protein
MDIALNVGPKHVLVILEKGVVITKGHVELIAVSKEEL